MVGEEDEEEEEYSTDEEEDLQAKPKGVVRVKHIVITSYPSLYVHTYVMVFIQCTVLLF